MTTEQERDDIDQFLPLRPVEFLVLAVLHDGEMHGYGMVQEIARRTEDRIEVKPGNLYRVLDRLMERGLLEETPQQNDEDRGDERRRYYAITARGTRVLRAEAELFGAIAAGVRAHTPAVERS